MVRVLVEMLAPYKGRVYDPCCGSGGMFVQSEKFVEAHGGRSRVEFHVIKESANFHADCIRAAQKLLHVVFSKVSQTRYEAGDQGTRMVCAVSAEHNESGGTQYFWFGLHPKQLEFLEAVPSAWLCFGCGSSGQTLVVPEAVVKPLLGQMSLSTGEDRHYWHVVVQKKNGKLILRLLGAADGPDLTEYLVSSQDPSTTA